VFLLILDSLGSTELLFILLMALVFFGPRKLPQLSRSLGKNLAEFRKASEDFKRTWEREVALESELESNTDRSMPSEESSILAAENQRNSNIPTITPVSEQVMARQPNAIIPGSPDSAAESTDTSGTSEAYSEPPRKQDWL
jgi:TatA/E family protein of Tat protein translocase